jgi:hypothetical protein
MAKRFGMSGGIDELGAHQREHEHRHEPQAQRDDLHQARPGAAAQVGEAVAPRAVRRGARPRDEADEGVADHGRRRERAREAAERDRRELEVPRLPRDERGERREARGERAEAHRLDHRHVAAQHAQRRHVAKPHQRREREAEQQHEADERAAQRRPRRRQRQGHREERREPAREERLRGVARDAAEHAPRESEQRELPCVQREDVRLRGTQATHHRRGIRLALREAARGERDRDRGEHHRKERGEAEEALRALERGAHLAAGIAHAFHALAPPEPRRHRRAVARDGRRISRDEQAIGDAAADLDEAGGGKVRLVHEHARRDAEVLEHAVGLARDDRGHLEIDAPHLEPVADLQAQPSRQRRRDPHRARLRRRVGRMVRRTHRRRDADAPAQREVGRDRLDVREVHAARRRHHARKRLRGRDREMPGARALDERRGHRVVGDHHEVAPEELVRLAIERRLHPVGEEADGRDTRHRDEEREEQHAQLTRAPVAPQDPRRQQNSIHASLTLRRGTTDEHG